MSNWSKRSKVFKVNLQYTPKGRAKMSIPALLIKGIDKPDFALFYIEQGEIKVKFKRSPSPTQTV